jgi:hypothetical protein
VPLALPIGLGVALLLLVGGLIVNNMNSSGRATATPTAVVAVPKATAAPAAAPTTAPGAGGPAATTAPSPAPAAPAGPGGPAPTSPPPTAVAAAPPGSAAANEATARLNDTMAALGRRDWAAAVDLANAGLKADPKSPALAKAAVQARLGRGQQLMAQGAERDALIHFIAVREEPLRSATSPNELREAELSVPYIWGNLMSNVDPSTALFEWTKAFRRDPNFKDVRKKVYDANVNLAKQAIARNDRAAALRNLNVAREADPNGPELNDLFKSVTPTP